MVHWCFSRFLNCTNGTKSRSASHLIGMESPPWTKERTWTNLRCSGRLLKAITPGTNVWILFDLLLYCINMNCYFPLLFLQKFFISVKTVPSSWKFFTFLWIHELFGGILWNFRWNARFNHHLMAAIVTYSSSCNLIPPFSGVLIGRHLIFCTPTWPTCCNSSRKC